MAEIARFNSDDFAAGERLDALQGLYAAVEEVEIAVDRDLPLHFDVHTASLKSVGLLSAQVSQMAPHRTAAQARDGKDDIVIAFILDGSVRFSPYRGDEHLLSPGEAYLGFNTRASRHELSDGARFFDITIPRAAIAPMVSDLDAASKDKLAPVPALSLLRDYAMSVLANGASLDPALSALCSTHILDLSALALGARRDAEEIARQGGLRHARLAAIKADVARNLCEPWLSLERVAQRHSISPQYLRALFYKDGTSFSHFVRLARLECAHGMLESPRNAHLRISDIAYAVGFGDLSHFNKAFRRHFGYRPSDLRNQ